MNFNYFSIFVGFITFYYLFYKFPMLDSDKNDEEIIKKKISIIIPARNEEKNLPNLLKDLQNQKYKVHEIICVDDGSTDSTAEIIKENGAKYLNIKDLPDGWKGKTWACQNGAKVATGDLLLFIDADVRFSSDALSSLVNHYEKKGNPISIMSTPLFSKFSIIETVSLRFGYPAEKYIDKSFLSSLSLLLILFIL